MHPLFLVFLGGGFGAALRWALVALIKPHAPTFPLGTLLVNLSGCLVIGLVAGWLGVHSSLMSDAASTSLSVPSAAQLPAAQAGTPPADAASIERWRLLLMVGVLGGYTTFSSLGLEAADLLRTGRPLAAGGYVVTSNVLGVLLTLAGLAVAQWLRRS